MPFGYCWGEAKALRRPAPRNGPPPRVRKDKNYR